MAAADDDAMAAHEDLVTALAAIPGLRDKGKVYPAFHLRSRAFLHFHDGEHGRYADVRFADGWERVPAATSGERADLLERVRRHVEQR